jgi:hypothetical protein
MLVTANMEETILFYQSVLGFTPTLKSPEYSIMERMATRSTSKWPNPMRL